jgi:Tfp pilus assembly protein PilF
LPLDEAASLQAFVERINEVFTPNACARVELAATYAQMGKLEEARAAVAEVMRHEPNYTIGGIARPTMVFKNAKDDEHYFDGLRKAGLPE